jgi:hypothetical protein
MLDIRTADELGDPLLQQRWKLRREGQQAHVLQRILGAFVETGGPVPLSAIVTAFPDRPAAAVEHSVRTLDAEDLVQLDDDKVVVAYPFCAAPTTFRVRLASGADRYACCAIDALGVAAMLGEMVHVASECHHCHEPLAFTVAAEGPTADAAGVMAWVESRQEGQRRIATSL